MDFDHSNSKLISKITELVFLNVLKIYRCDRSNITVRIGALRDLHIRAGSQIFNHEDYEYKFAENNIALIKLNVSMAFSKSFLFMN